MLSVAKNALVIFIILYLSNVSILTVIYICFFLPGLPSLFKGNGRPSGWVSISLLLCASTLVPMLGHVSVRL